MKRIITYISILAAVLTASVSCSREEAFDGSKDSGKIKLVFHTEKMGTRVTVSDPGNPETIAGEGAENTITHVDYFFFADDDPDSEAIVSGRLAVSELTKVSDTEYTYEGFETEDTTSSDYSEEYEALKQPSYLYVLVNYPSEEELTAKTMNELLALPITTDFTKAQSSFVMDSYDKEEESALIYLAPKSNAEEREVDVKLSRVAAKLVLNINVKNSFTDAADNEWTPVTDQMWVNFLNARKYTTVAAEALEFDEKTNYFQTAQESPTETDAVDDEHTSWVATPVYTYPLSYETSDVTAPYFKIYCPWICEKKGLNNFYYKIILPELGTFERNKIYTLTVDLSVIGGTEDDWALVSDYIFVADWWAPEAIESSFEGAMYLDVPVKEYEIYGVDDVYIPVRSSNDIRITQTATSNSTTINGTKTNLYNGNTVNVTGSTTEITKDGFKFVHALNNDITSNNFDCTPITFTMYVRHTTGGLSKYVEVRVTQYPSIYAQADASNGYAFVNSYSGIQGRGRYESSTYDYGTNTNRGPIARNNNNDKLSSVAGSISSGGGSQNNNGNQYIVHVSVLPTGYKVAGMTEDAIIGDPRGGRLAQDYLGYAAGANGGRVNGVQNAYNAVSTSTQNVIAPAIRIASSWGATGTLANYNRAEERCASYQENGYPAGRWRVPTVAEIDFLIRLSENNHIPELFTCGTSGTGNNRYYLGYWANGPAAYAGASYTAAQGRPYETGSGSGSPIVTINGSRFDNVVRCVYDEWYWSEQKYGNNGQPSNTAATQWLGFIF